MFKVFEKLKSDRRGFTLVELLTTMAILLIALTLTVNLLGVIWQNYRKVEYRWIVQTAVEYVAGCFQRDANREALATADMCDLYYETMPAANDSGDTAFTLACAPELGTLTYNKENHTLTTDTSGLTDALKAVLDENSIYFISYDNHFYVIRYDDLYTITTSGENKTKTYISTTKYPIAQDLGLIEKEEADVQVQVEFAVSGNPLPFNETTHKESKPGENGATYTKYLPAGVTATIKGTVQDASYEFEKNESEFVSTIDLQNIDVDKGMSVNKTGSLLSSKYVAGWDKGGVKYYPGTNGMPSVANDGYPQNPTEPANVVKYHSINTPVDFSDVVQDSSFHINVNMPICLFFSASIGVDNQQNLLQPIRDFRDNVLRGNWFGEKVIDVYYNDVSPVAVKVMHDIPVVRAVMQEVTKCVSKTLSLVE